MQMGHPVLKGVILGAGMYLSGKALASNTQSPGFEPRFQNRRQRGHSKDRGQHCPVAEILSCLILFHKEDCAMEDIRNKERRDRSYLVVPVLKVSEMYGEIKSSVWVT